MALVLLLTVSAFSARSASGQAWCEPPEKGKGPVDELRVDAAITLGLEHVKGRQRANGSFPGHDAEYPMGMTALCLLTMVKSGVAPMDPAVTKALDHVRYLPFRKTYSTGCLLMALEALHPRGAREWAAAGAKFLLETRQVRHGGTWGYPTTGYETSGNLGRPDLSNTQYAVLALRSAQRLGVRVPPAAFADVVKFLVDDQAKSGSLGYLSAGEGTGSMTTAGLAIIAIAEDAAGKSAEFRRRGGAFRDAFKRGMSWFERNYTVEWNPVGDQGARNKHQLAYYLYGVERLCDFRSIKTVAGHDWYSEGARFLLANQQANGSWGRLEDTCFALLFLSRSFLSVSREIRSEAVAERRKTLQQRRQQQATRVKPPDPARVPFVREWLVLGPFRVKNDNALDRKAHPRPRGCPRAGATARKRLWQVHRFPIGGVDLESVFKRGNRRLAYVANHFHVPRDQEVLIWLGTHDAWRIWINGQEVRSELVRGMGGPDRWRIPAKFNKGLNTVLVLVEDHTRNWAFHFRISDPRSGRVPGLLQAPSTARLKRMARKTNA